MTRARLIEAAETIFMRKGFDDASVEEISESAGYSRGAFYSNFENKEQVFLELIDRRRPKALDSILGDISEASERVAALREWFSKQWQLKDLIALRMEFSRRAMRDRSVQTHLTELLRRELETYAGSVRRYLDEANYSESGRPELVALALLAASRGLAMLAIDTAPEWEHRFKKAAELVFDRMISQKPYNPGEAQC